MRRLLHRILPRRLRVHLRLGWRLTGSVLSGGRLAGPYARHWLLELRADLADLLLPARVECPLCGWRGRAFHPFVSGPRVTRDTDCPRCEAKPRHRVLHLYLMRVGIGAAADGAPVRLLDIAPAPCLAPRLRELPRVFYLSADLERPDVMLRTDLRRAGILSESIDVLVCYHVLEHILEDRPAMGELRRILRPDGLGLVQVPVDRALDATEEWGEPDPDRHGHVRQYGRDFPDRLREQGLDVTVVRDLDFAAPAEVARFGLVVDPFCVVRPT